MDSKGYGPSPVDASGASVEIQKAGMNAWVHCAAVLLVLAGCNSVSPTPYIAPCIRGRVLDAQTSQPLAQVTVRKVTSHQTARTTEFRHGGAQMLEATPLVRTGPDGAFVLDSERALTLFRPSGWFGVSVAFELQGYQRQVVDYTLVNATNNANGEPIIQAGDIRLAPVRP